MSVQHLSDGVTVLKEPIIVGHSTWLLGSNKGSIIKWEGDGPYAVIVGTPSASYHNGVRNVFIEGGGVYFQRFSNLTTIENVQVIQAKEHGFYFNGIGDGLKLRNCIATHCLKDGFHVASPVSNNAIVFDGCTASSNLGCGITIKPATSTGHAHTLIRDCIIQGNGGDAEIYLKGWAGPTRIEGATWLEPVATVGKKAILVESNKIGSVTRHPHDLVIDGETTIALSEIAITLESCVRCRINVLRTKAPIVYKPRSYTVGGQTVLNGVTGEMVGFGGTISQMSV